MSLKHRDRRRRSNRQQTQTQQQTQQQTTNATDAGAQLWYSGGLSTAYGVIYRSVQFKGKSWIGGGRSETL